jgi:hypothetical protein
MTSSYEVHASKWKNMETFTKVVSMENILICTLWLHETHEKHNHCDHIVNLSTLLCLHTHLYHRSCLAPCLHIFTFLLYRLPFPLVGLCSQLSKFLPLLLSPPPPVYYLHFFLIVGSIFMYL